MNISQMPVIWFRISELLLKERKPGHRDLKIKFRHLKNEASPTVSALLQSAAGRSTGKRTFIQAMQTEQERPVTAHQRRKRVFDTKYDISGGIYVSCSVHDRENHEVLYIYVHADCTRYLYRAVD